MDEIQKIYHDISTVDDINKYLSNTDDGESGIIEFKAVDRLSDEKDKSKKANFRAKIAKEMCAFANSEGGILVVGVKVENGKVVPSCKEPNLEDFLEKQKIGTYLEPSLKGLNFKSLGVEDGSNKPVIIMIPKSDFYLIELLIIIVALTVKIRILLGNILLEKVVIVTNYPNSLCEQCIYLWEELQGLK